MLLCIVIIVLKHANMMEKIIGSPKIVLIDTTTIIFIKREYFYIITK